MKKILSILSILSFTLVGCKGPVAEDFGVENPEQYSKLYMPKAYNGTVDLVLNIPSDTTILLATAIGGIKIWDKSVTVTLAENPELVNKYNKDNGTLYKMLPSDCYSIDGNTVQIDNGKNSTALKLTINSEKFPGLGPFVLPFSIISVSDATLKVNESLRTVYFVVKGTYAENPYTYIDRKDWKVLYCSSFSEKATEYTPPELMLDGNPNTYWGTAFNPVRVQPPHTVVFDLKNEQTIHGMYVRARVRPTGEIHPNGVVKRISLYTSNDNENFTEAGEFILKYDLENTVYLNYAAKGRYVKFITFSNYSGPSKEFYQSCMSEFKLF